MFVYLFDRFRIMGFSRSPASFRWRILSYYLSRLVVNRILRRYIVSALRAWIGKASFVNKSGDSLIDTLKRVGIVNLTHSLSDAQCKDIDLYLSDKFVHGRLVSDKRRMVDIPPDETSLRFYAQEDVLNCPHVMEFVNSPMVLDLAAEYLGCAPTLSGVVVQWSFPTDNPSVVQNFHRDREDWKFLRFFVYLSDVVEGCGPHVFIKGSHLDTLPFRLKIYSPNEIEEIYGASSFLNVYGPRGTAFVADTSGIHKGEAPKIKPRLILSFTYSILPNYSFRYKPIRTRHSSNMNTYSNRLFLL